MKNNKLVRDMNEHIQKYINRNDITDWLTLLT